ncbi:hypothetical protein PF008_g533 [Phytophthora fragariae]|uniref:Protein phosphatase 1 regulatory subunit 7 n=1 Tax=Phytophthora fragariae TaxID=53985 RepID=A0A6G0SMX5_9STRA|nr:hypothetical protein PF008_g533 [Phytophthora fragariae]
METGRGSSNSVDSSALPPIAAATAPVRLPSAKSHRSPSKQLSRGGSFNSASEDELLPESDAMQSETVTEAASNTDALSVSQQEKMQLFATCPDLELLCRENGLSAAQFARNSDTVTSLDLFLGFWTSMKSVVYYPALRELSIINQPTICELEGVNNCRNLEKLCITECGLTKIANLGNCTKLKQLNLSSNKIRRLENLDALVNLEKLWVNQNELERLDGLWRLTKLTQLWACRNRIDRIDTALNGCVNLAELNLADNRLSSFKGLLSLTNLDELAALVLSDPHFGDNPVCRLCNYQTYLMCQLPRLSFLDTVELSARNKQIAEATMIKKKMYYNMRIKAIKRDVHGRIRHAETIRNQAEHHMETSVSALVRHKKEIERFLVENSAKKDEIAAKVSQEMLNALEKKLECVSSCVRDRYSAVYRMNQDFERLRTSLRSTSEMNIARLLLELETGGNIRLEDGKPSDAWFGSCVELVRSRLFLPELQKLGVNDIQINRVTRINNRFLRNRFQARMEEVLVAPAKKVKDNVSKKGVTVPNGDIDAGRESENSKERNLRTPQEHGKRGNQPQNPCPGSTLETSMEYLFYAQSALLEDHQVRSPADTEQLFIAENGFRGFSGLGTTDFGAAIKLSSSIALLDAPRVTATLVAKGQQVVSNVEPLPSQQRLTQDMKRALQLAASGDWDLPCGVLLVAKVFPGYTKCISNADVALAKATSGSTLGKAQDFTGVQSLQVMHGGAATTTAGGEAAANKQKLYYVFDSALVLPEYFVEYQYTFGKDLVGLSTAVNLRIASFSDNAIKRIDGLQACTRLEELCLDDNEIAQIENLEQLCFLKKLHLGRNRLTAIQHLNSLENLIQLSLEENQISSLRGLGSALKLMELYLGNNQIENLKEVQHLKSLPKLTILDLSGNEITRLPDYRLYTVYYLRRVKVLDGVSVSTQDQSNAKQKYSGKLTFEFILEKCGGGNVTPSGSGGENQFGRIIDMDVSSCRIREIGSIPGDVFSNVREINLENNQITDISGLEALPKLRVLNLNRNRIEKLMPSSQSSEYTVSDTCDGGGKGILSCLNLEQLHLAYNQITDMTTLGLQFLDSLKVLHLQGNAIVFLAGLECNTELVDIRLDKNRIRQLDPHSTLALRQVKFLNLEDNGLKSLSNFNNMLSLETLELSNNRLTDLEEVEKLASLPSLIDLRLNNNPLTKKHLYRQHVLYKLNSLKVLDGKDVYSDEKERIDILFLHERAAAASGTNPNAAERLTENRTVYQTQLFLTPSSIPTKGSSSVGISQPLGIPHNEVLTGSLLRKTPTTPLPVPTPPPILSPPTFPLPEHEVDLSIAIAPSNTTTRSLLAPAHSSYRNPTSLGSQSSWQVGTTGGGSSLPSTSTATVASAISANLAKGIGNSGVEQLYVGSTLRRRLSSVHYDQQQNSSPSLQVNGNFNGSDTKLPVGIISSQAVVRGPSAAIRRGFNMQPTPTESQSKPSSDHVFPSSTIPTTNDTGNNSGRSFAGYVVTYGNQKRYSSYPGSQQETTIPYLSTKLQQQSRRSSERR